MAGLGAHCSVAAVGEHIDLVVVLPIHVAGLGAREVEAVPSLAAVVVRHKVIVAEEPHKVAAEGEGPSPAGPEEVLDYTAREEERCILDLGDTEVLRKELEGDHRAVGHRTVLLGVEAVPTDSVAVVLPILAEDNLVLGIGFASVVACRGDCCFEVE